MIPIAKEEFEAGIGFSKRLGIGFNIIGRKDVFKRFKVVLMKNLSFKKKALPKKYYTLGLKHFHLPKTELISNEVLSLPMYLTLAKEETDYIIEKINNFFSEKR